MPARWNTVEPAQNYSMVNGPSTTTATNNVTNEVLTMSASEFGIILRAEQQILGPDSAPRVRGGAWPYLRCDFDALKLAVWRIRNGSYPF